MITLPNILTSLRVLLIPIFVLLFYRTPGTLWSALIFTLTALTDILDGHLARKRKEVTVSGQFLDPVADKLLVASGLILLVEAGRVPAWMAIALIGREIFITGFRGIASSQGVMIAAERYGKFKMIFQVIAIIIFLIDFPSGMFQGLGLDEGGVRNYFLQLGFWVLSIALILALFSATQYLVKFWRVISPDRAIQMAETSIETPPSRAEATRSMTAL